MQITINSIKILFAALFCGLAFQGFIPSEKPQNEFGEIVVDDHTMIGILGCDVTIKAENKSNKTITILFEESDVKTKTGTWSNIYFGNFNKSRCDKATVKLNAKSATKSNVCEMDMGCNFERRYRFKLKCNDNGKISYFTRYYPSSTSYADKGKSVIDLGNVGKHFN